MPMYQYNFWHKNAHDNIPSPDCLIFCVKLKTENQLIQFKEAFDWNVVRHSAKCYWSGDWPMASLP